jgi:hypothetical protein
MVQARCADISGFAVLKAFRVVPDTNNMLTVYLDLLQSMQYIDPIRIAWNLHNLTRPPTALK